MKMGYLAAYSCYHIAMGNSPDRILIVVQDPAVSDLIGQQTLQPLGFQVQVLGDAAAAVALIQQFQPDVILVDLDLAGLSGKDFLLGLSSQGIQTPVIVIARRGKEADAIQAFRLGASDYLLWPARDTEVLSVVERVFKQVRERRERQSLSRQLQQTNQELQTRVRELTTVFSVGKTIAALAPPQVTYDRIVEGSLRACGADIGWLLICGIGTRSFTLAAQRGLPANLARLVNRSWEDGLSSLVATSGEAISLYGENLQRFTPISDLGQAALIVPIKIDKQVNAVLAMVRKAQRPFTPGEQSLLEATAGYASIALANQRVVQNLEMRLNAREEASSAEGELSKSQSDRLRDLATGLRSPLESALDYTGQLLRGRKGRLPTELQPMVFSLQEKLVQINRLVLQMSSSSSSFARHFRVINLNELSRQALARFHRLAQQNGLRLASDLASPPVLAWGDAAVMTQVLDGLISNAVKFSRPGGQITLKTSRTNENLPQLQVRDTGIGIDPQKLSTIFDAKATKGVQVGQSPESNAPDLHAIQDLIVASEGRIWVDSRPGEGTSINISLPVPKEKQNP